MDKLTRHFVMTETRGGLPYAVHWFSLDSRPQCKYFETFDDASVFEQHLMTLKRPCSMWLNLASCRGENP